MIETRSAPASPIRVGAISTPGRREGAPRVMMSPRLATKESKPLITIPTKVNPLFSFDRNRSDKANLFNTEPSRVKGNNGQRNSNISKEAIQRKNREPISFATNGEKSSVISAARKQPESILKPFNEGNYAGGKGKTRETHSFYSNKSKPEMTGRIERKVVESRKGVGIQPVNKSFGEKVIQGEATEIKRIPVPAERKQPLTRDQAVQTLSIFAHQPKEVRKLTPEIHEAFKLTTDSAKSPLSRAVTQLTGDNRQGVQAIPGVSEDAMRFLDRVFVQKPALKQSVDKQVAIATTVMANYMAIGHSIDRAAQIVLISMEEAIRKEIKKALITSQPELGFPEEEETAGGEPENKKEAKDTETSEEEKITFARAEDVNTRRIRELIDLARMMIEKDDTSQEYVNPQVVAQVWRLTTDNVSPIIKDIGKYQGRIDGSWDEICEDMLGWGGMTLQEFTQRIERSVMGKTAVAIGENPDATDQDVVRVLTIPADYNLLRMTQRHEVSQAA